VALCCSVSPNACDSATSKSSASARSRAPCQPGIIRTSPHPLAAEYTKIMIAQTPVGRARLPSGIAGAVAYLASADASFVNGATWSLDGGFAV
jgi:NAD(P)-dependent dehydrogenase (short-subunit alcohol dehydrogenase family)